MFTLEEIKTAHGKVKSGADFPDFVRQIGQMGVKRYETFVTDGHTDYYGSDNYKASAAPKYSPLSIATSTDDVQFKADLKTHQQGRSDYSTFCNQAAQSGIEKWEVNIDAMTCIYYDREGREVLVEVIPE